MLRDQNGLLVKIRFSRDNPCKTLPGTCTRIYAVLREFSRGKHTPPQFLVKYRAYVDLP